MFGVNFIKYLEYLNYFSFSERHAKATITLNSHDDMYISYIVPSLLCLLVLPFTVLRMLLLGKQTGIIDFFKKYHSLHFYLDLDPPRKKGSGAGSRSWTLNIYLRLSDFLTNEKWIFKLSVIFLCLLLCYDLNHLEVKKSLMISLFLQKFRNGFYKQQEVFFYSFLFDILTLESGSVDSHMFIY